MSMAERAAQPFVRFTDTQGRELSAEILEIEADQLRIRRMSDRLEMDLPVALLSPGDRAFAAYLWEIQQATSRPPRNSTDEDELLDRIFGTQ